MLCLNIGSGQRPFRTTGDYIWVNVDINPKWKPDVVADGAKLDMYADNSVDFIVSHHVLEHFGCGEAAPAIREFNRILKPGGVLRVFVPDMRALAKGWIDGRIDTQVYMTNVYGAYMDSEADRHKWGFTYKSLERFIKDSAAWRFVNPVPLNHTMIGANLAQDWWVISMEIVK